MAEPAGSSRPDALPRPWGTLAIRVAVALVLAALLASCATGLATSSARVARPTDSTPVPSLDATGSTVTDPTAGATGPTAGATDSIAIPAADTEAIRRAIAQVNATAGGPVAAQRAVLDDLAQPAEADQQRDCPVAHSTLRLDPVYADLRTPPADPTASSPTGVHPTPPTIGSTESDRSTESTGSRSAAPSPSAASPFPTTSTPGGSRAYLLPVLITIYTGDRITGTDLATLRLFVIDGMARTGRLCVS